MSRIEKSSVTIYMGDDTVRAQRNGENAQKDKDRSTIYAGNLKQNMDPIAMRKQQLQKQAMKTVKDQFAVDGKIDDELAARRQRIADMKEVAAGANEQIVQCKEELASLKENYGIEDDSQEQQDLELIKKANKQGVSGLSDEEVERLANMGELTDYQSLALGYESIISYYQKDLDEANKAIMTETSVIKGMKQGLLGRKYDMTDADTAKEEAMQQASKEIVGMLFAEAKDKIEEKMEELIEQAKEEVEKRKEQEEKLEGQKADKEETDTGIEEQHEDMQKDMADLGDRQSKVQDEVSKLLKEADLLEEDLKGIQIDRQL